MLPVPPPSPCPICHPNEDGENAAAWNHFSGMMFWDPTSGFLKCTDCGYQEGDWIVFGRPIRPSIVVKLIFVFVVGAAFGYFAVLFLGQQLGVA